MATEQHISTQDFLDGIRAGDRVLIGKAITLLESVHPEHRKQATALLQACLPYSGNALRIGITGVPGAGKSTFIEQLGLILVAEGKQVAVLAVDPSGQKSKGSILGDKTRMQELSKSEKVFIRPSPAGAGFGGVAARTRETIILLEAAGYDHVLVETVGVGQSETAVFGMTDVFLLLLLAGAGDELQGIKRGIMEMADIVAINKDDGENRPRVRIAKADVERALHLFQPGAGGWTAPVFTCSSTEGTGIAEILESIYAFISRNRSNGLFDGRRKKQQTDWFRSLLQGGIMEHILTGPAFVQALTEAENQVAAGNILPPDAVAALLQKLP